MAMISLGVGYQQPSHPAAEIAVGMGPVQQVEVVGHQAVSQQIDGQRAVASAIALAKAL